MLTEDDDQGDQITMRVGIHLYEKYGGDLTEERLRQGIIDAMDQLEQVWCNSANLSQVRTRK